MTQVKLIKFEIKPGRKEAWLKWIKELETIKDEVIQTLKKEGITSESCFISEDSKYLYYFMESNDFKKANDFFMNSLDPIDKKHKEELNVNLKYINTLENLFHFSTIDTIKNGN